MSSLFVAVLVVVVHQNPEIIHIFLVDYFLSENIQSLRSIQAEIGHSKSLESLVKLRGIR